MSYIPKFIQFFLIFIYENPKRTIFLCLLLFTACVVLVTPYFLPLTDKQSVDGFVVFYPRQIIPIGKEYQLTVRSDDPDRIFEVKEGNEYISIIKRQNLDSSVNSKEITAIFCTPSRIWFSNYAATLSIVFFDDDGVETHTENINLPIYMSALWIKGVASLGAFLGFISILLSLLQGLIALKH